MKKCLCNFYSSISKTIIILSLLQTAVAICPPGHDWNSLTGECVGCRDKYFKIDTETMHVALVVKVRIFGMQLPAPNLAMIYKTANAEMGFKLHTT